MRYRAYGGYGIVKQRLVGVAKRHATVPLLPPAWMQPVHFQIVGKSVEEWLDGIIVGSVLLVEQTPADH